MCTGVDSLDLVLGFSRAGEHWVSQDSWAMWGAWALLALTECSRDFPDWVLGWSKLAVKQWGENVPPDSLLAALEGCGD